MSDTSVAQPNDDLLRSFDDYLARFFPEELRQRHLKSADPGEVAGQISKDVAERVKQRLAASR